MSTQHPLARAAAIPARPDPLNRLISVCIGDEAFEAECSVTGRYHPAVTQADPEHCYPEEYPEVEVVRLWLSDLSRDMSGLLEDAHLYELVLDTCVESVGDELTEL